MKYQKPPLTLHQQIETLQNRGLIIGDIPLATRYLSNISYYRLRAYTYPYQNNNDSNHPFIGSVSFDNIIQLYSFDRKIRLLVFDAIEKIEIAFRTQLIYHWAIKHGSHWHLDQNLYQDPAKFIKHLNSLQKEINRSNETFIGHYKHKYSHPSDPPSWMSLEVTSIGLLSLIFQNLKSCPEKKAFTHHFGLLSNDVMANWMHHLSNIRNICAHHGRLWNRRIAIPLNIPGKTKIGFVQNTKFYPYKLYASLVVINYILSVINPESSFKSDLLSLLKSCPMGQLKEMGFPKNWNQEKFWQA